MNQMDDLTEHPVAVCVGKSEWVEGHVQYYAYLPQGTLLYTAAQMRHHAKKAVEAERERIQDEFSISVQSDLEHGVKSLNEKAAKDFQANYPELNKFWGWLNALD